MSHPRYTMPKYRMPDMYAGCMSGKDQLDRDWSGTPPGLSTYSTCFYSDFLQSLHTCDTQLQCQYLPKGSMDQRGLSWDWVTSSPDLGYLSKDSARKVKENSRMICGEDGHEKKYTTELPYHICSNGPGDRE